MAQVPFKRENGLRVVLGSRLESSVFWLRGLDLNQRPLGYEPNELPGCSTPHYQCTNTG